MQSPTSLIDPARALAGRATPRVVARPHLYLRTSLMEPFPSGLQHAYFGMGCFWGAERIFWQTDGVVVTRVGYQGGFTPNPTYEEVCSGRTGHAEMVHVVFDPAKISYGELVVLFFENHDPTQGMRQGADTGTQYRSAIYTTSPEQVSIADEVLRRYAEQLHSAGYGAITTEVLPAGPFYLAEEYHQQYLIANPNGYCGIGGTGVACPRGVL